MAQDFANQKLTQCFIAGMCGDQRQGLFGKEGHSTSNTINHL